jgi:L-threonylcarbamoyladenylate synthase
MSNPKIRRSGKRVIRVDPLHPQPDLISQAAELIRQGGVLAFPTETFYGLGTNALNSQAIDKIYRIKRREREKPILILIESGDKAEAFVKPFSPAVKLLMEAFWPGPLTILFQASDRLPGKLTAGTGKIGIRVPSHPVAEALLSAVQMPLTGTSANRSEGVPPRTAEEVRSSLGRELDLVLDAGPTPGKKPSTLLDCTVIPFRIVREGVISRAAIERVAGELAEE